MCVGCLGVGASASATAGMVKKEAVEEAKEMTEKQVLTKLGGLPESKLDCVKLTVMVMRRTVAEYMSLGPFKPNGISERCTLWMKWLNQIWRR